MKAIKNPYLTVIGWLHTLTLFLSFYPMMALIFDFDSSVFGRYCLSGSLLIFPVALSWFAVTRSRHMSGYTFFGLTVSFCFGWLMGMLGSFCGIGFYEEAVISGILSLVLFLIRGKLKIDRGKRQKEFEELCSVSPEQAGETEPELPTFIEAPHPVHWCFLAAHYILGALAKCDSYWHMAYALLLADVFLCLAYRIPHGLEQFLRQNSRLANLPACTMKKIGRIVLGISAVLLLLFVVPSFLYGKEPLSQIEPKEIDRIFENEEPEAEPEISEQLPLWLPSDGQESAPPKAVQYSLTALLYVICLGAALAALTAIYRACRHAGKAFSAESEDEVEFLDQGLLDQAGRFRKRMARQNGVQTVSLRIRRYYKRTIRRSLKETLRGTETPTELEDAAGLGETKERRLLHDCYEKARYSREGCTAEDAVELKKGVPDSHSVL